MGPSVVDIHANIMVGWCLLIHSEDVFYASHTVPDELFHD